MEKQVRLPEDFFLGAAASAWQTEGWSGKKPHQDSYIDLWYKEDRYVWHQGYGPAVATNYYERYKEDIGYMKEIGLHCYRTSINWSRFLTDYEDITVDEEYASYYDAMLDEMIAQGIEPMVCLEHYEVPARLMKQYGGWSSRRVVDLYLGYVEAVLKRYSHKVKYWFAFNEPVVVQTRIHLDAIRYPYFQDSHAWMLWNYHKALATNLAMKLYTDGGYRIRGGKFGTIINVEMAYPRGNAPFDLEAADKYDMFYNRVFLEPAFKGEFEPGLFEICEQYGIQIERNETDLLWMKENPVDWVGINLYHPNRVKGRSMRVADGAPFHPDFFYEMFDLPGRKMNPHRGWEVYPRMMYDFALRMNRDYSGKEWFIAESGMGVEKEEQFKNDAGVIQDDYRIQYIKENLYWLLKGVSEGSKCKGFMLWAFTDNVSPMNAFKNRYGLVEIDLTDNRNRHLKKSALFYQRLIRTGAFQMEDDEGECK